MKRRDRDTFSGGYWTRPDHTGRARTRRQAQDRATYDHQPKRPGFLARLINRGTRR
ncbi:hypothetical protein ACFV1F_17105 [Streptomyces sp. NPDC059590]|uniref:hypothetical protein n=1 Tax=Streptomyces sp. NPDC059590 TaxID=3346877 RepID=UPI003692DC11